MFLFLMFWTGVGIVVLGGILFFVTERIEETEWGRLQYMRSNPYGTNLPHSSEVLKANRVCKVMEACLVIGTAGFWVGAPIAAIAVLLAVSKLLFLGAS